MPISTEDSPEKETVALDEEELDILDAIRQTAPRHRINKKLAQTYGVWTVCFRRYCQEKGVPWLWMSSVSDFMDFLDAHPNVSTPERDRALDGIMFYITDVHEKRQEDENTENEEPTSIPRSTQSLFAKILLRCDVHLTQALQMRRKDVHLDEATVVLSSEEDGKQKISLPSTLNEGLKHHLKRVEDDTTSTNPLLFRDRDESDNDGESTNSSEESIERSTELATRVMQTFSGKETTDDADEE